MNNNLSAGLFETELAKRLALHIKSADELTEMDVSKCYRAVATSLNLSTSPADDLHVQDIYAVVAELIAKNRGADSRVIERKIFDMIYMH